MSLLAKCCRRNFADNGTGALDGGDDFDWPLFLSLARFHRVQGLVWHSLYSAGLPVADAVAEHLRSDAETIAAANLRAVVESREIRDQFEKAGIPLLFVKGLTLGKLAYRTPLLKMSWDVDLLVALAQMNAAGEILRSRGYRLVLPTEIGRLGSWHRQHKESVWRHEDGPFVELHTRLADNPRLIPDVGIGSARQSVEVAPGLTLPTLADDELFAYLSVHGASSAWFRLKWITDFAAFLSGRSPAEIERLYERSQELGAGRASGQALLVADRFYGTLDGTGLKPRLLQDRMSLRLAQAAIRQIAGRAEPKEPTSTPLGTATIHWTQLLLLPGIAFKFGEIARQLRDALSARRA